MDTPAMKTIPAPPPGFVVNEVPPPPSGFVLDQRVVPEPSQVFRAEQVNPRAVDPSDVPPISPGLNLAREVASRLKGGLREEAGQMVGGTIGGIAAPVAVSALYPPAAPALLAGAGIIGAGIGGGAGEAIHQRVDPYKEASWSNVGWAVAEEAGSEALGAGITKLGSAAKGAAKATGRSAKRLVPPALRNRLGISTARPPKMIRKPHALMKEVGQEFADRTRAGLLPTQQTDLMRDEIVESMARGGWATRGIFQRFQQEQNEKAAQFAREKARETYQLMTKEAPGELPQHGIGQSLFDMIHSPTQGEFGKGAGQLWESINETTGPIYEEIDRRLGSRFVTGYTYKGVAEVPTGILDANGQMVTRSVPQWKKGREVIGFGPSTQDLKDYAAKLLAKDDIMGGAAKPGYGLLSSEGRNQLQAIQEWPDQVPFGFMKERRTEWLRRNQRLGKEMDTSTGIVDDLIGKATEAMKGENVPAGMPEDILRTLNNVNRVHATAREAYEKAFRLQIADDLSQNPEKWYDIVIGSSGKSGEGPLERITTVRNALRYTPRGTISPEGDLLWKRMQAGSTMAVIDRATTADVVNGKSILKYMNAMGNKTLRALHGDEGITVLNRTMALSELMRKRAETAGLVMHSAQVGAIAGAGTALLYGGQVSGSDMVAVTVAGGVLIGPRVLARALTTQKGYRIIEEIAMQDLASKKLGPLSVRLVRLLQKQDADEVKKMRTAIIQGDPKFKDRYRELEGFGL